MDAVKQTLTNHWTRIGLFLGLVLGVGTAFIVSQPIDLAARSFGPLLKTEMQVKRVPMLAEAVRDPEVEKRQPRDDFAASRLQDEIREQTQDLKRARGARRAELLGQIYRNHAAMAYFLEDVASGRIDSRDYRDRVTNRLATTRGQLVKSALAAAKALKGKSAKAAAAYHVAATQYVTGASRSGSIRSLRKLKHLSGYLKRRQTMLVAIHDLRYGGKSTRAKASQALRGVIGGLDSDGAMTVRLELARDYANINRNGVRRGAADKRYRSWLWGASKRVSRLSPVQQQQVLAYSMGIWRGVEGRRGSWAKPPVNLNNFKQTLAVKAVIERVALEDWRKKRERTAVKKYQTLASSLAGTPQRAAFDRRILDMQRLRAKKAKQPKLYQTALEDASRAYLDPGILGDGQDAAVQQMSAEIQRRYKSFVFAELAAVSSRKSSRNHRRRTIELAEVYMLKLQDNAEIEAVKSKIAPLHVLNKDFRKAVDLYRDLAETNVSGKTVQYLKQAIGALTIIAKWEARPPWKGPTRGPDAEREELLGLYKKLQEKQGDWSIIAHIGLLEITQNRADTAFALWRQTLDQQAAGPHAAEAAGWMMTTYEQASQWDKLEDIARLATTKGMKARFKGRPINSKVKLALALLEGGKVALAAEDYNKAVTKLEEFVKNFRGAANHDHGMYLLARAYRGQGQHVAAIKTLQQFVQVYSKSKYIRPVLLDGGDWSASMAYEENAMKFYEKFLSRFGRDEQAPRVRQEVTAIQLGRGLYGQAIAILKMQAGDRQVPARERFNANFKVMELEERYGSQKRAYQTAQQISKSADADESELAHALGVQVRYHAAQNNYRAVQSTAGQLETLGVQIAQENLGEARYILAHHHGEDAIKEYYNLALKDPMKKLEELYKSYRTARGQYNKVCAAGRTSYCAPAMLRLSQLSLDFLRSLEDIQIQSQLSAKVVSSFNERKQKILNDVTASAEAADRKSIETIAAGHTDPDTTSQVLWNNGSDWNFQRVSGDAGNVFVQWPAAE